ncbi:lysine-rich arabinogalactan protein 19-like [Ooceraea biroi]|uniref:lysine-rich arabinogalactan protein 19-like n=1 Tax=Ooceraea biroi TaxID=2015173 RepID=UPI0005B9901C|nr:lysine-rich arabinogalactan protein 19-like [Ooceraea biroi]
MGPTKRGSESSSSPSENNPREPHAVEGNSSGEPPRKRNCSRSPSSDFPSISSPSQSPPPSHSSSSSLEILSPRSSPCPSPVPSSPWYSPIGSPNLEEHLDEPIPPRSSPEPLTTGQSFPSLEGLRDFTSVVSRFFENTSSIFFPPWSHPFRPMHFSSGLRPLYKITF